MPRVLECAHALERDRAADVDVGRRDVDPELHPQRPAELELLLEAARGQNVDRVAGEIFHAIAGLDYPGTGALPEKTRPEAAAHPQAQTSRPLVILGVLGPASFTFGLLDGGRDQDPAARPGEAAHAGEHLRLRRRRPHDARRSCAARRRGSSFRRAQISPWMKHAIVAIEDKRFYEHRGVDMRGMARALWADVTHHGAVQGGSTITQQFVKNAYLTSQKSIGRKLIEAALAWQLEQKWTKDQILTAYLNTVYFGNGAYGVEQASASTSSTAPATLNPAEAALLAAIPEDPSLWDPVAHPARRGAPQPRPRAALRAGLPDRRPVPHLASLPDAEPDEGEPSRRRRESRRRTSRTTSRTSSSASTVRSRAFGGGLKVTTTLESNLQRIARQAVSSVLTEPDGPTAALVALDVHTGAVLAMVGGQNYHKSQFNLATQGERQPGSAFKPFVLAAALRKGIAPSTILASKPVTIDAGGRLWQVNNYEGEYLGPIDLTEGDRVLRQLRLLAADRDRRAERSSADRGAARASPRRFGRTSRSGSAPSPRHRSRWRAPTARSPTAATASTARSSATSRARSRR